MKEKIFFKFESTRKSWAEDQLIAVDLYIEGQQQARSPTYIPLMVERQWSPADDKEARQNPFDDGEANRDQTKAKRQ